MGASTGAGERNSRTQLMKEFSTSPYLPRECPASKHSQPQMGKRVVRLWDMSPVVRLWDMSSTMALKGLVKGLGRFPVSPPAKCTKPLIQPHHMSQVPV